LGSNISALRGAGVNTASILASIFFVFRRLLCTVTLSDRLALVAFCPRCATCDLFRSSRGGAAVAGALPALEELAISESPASKREKKDKFYFLTQSTIEACKSFCNQ